MFQIGHSGLGNMPGVQDRSDHSKVRWKGVDAFLGALVLALPDQEVAP